MMFERDGDTESVDSYWCPIKREYEMEDVP
jgi:hypothetical protein